MLLEYMIDENNIDIEKSDVNFVTSLIKGEKLKSSEKDKGIFSLTIISFKT